MDNQAEQLRFVGDFWNSRIGQAYRGIITPQQKFIEITSGKHFPPDYLEKLKDLPPNHKLYVGTFYTGTTVWNENTIAQLDTFSDQAGRIDTDSDWRNVLKLQNIQHFFSQETKAVSRVVDTFFSRREVIYKDPTNDAIRSHFKSLTVNPDTMDARYWGKSAKRPDVVICTYIAQELALQPQGSERFPTLKDFEAFAGQNGIQIQWQAILEGFEQIMSEEYVRRLIDSDRLSREDLPFYFANVASWVHGAALKRQQELTTKNIATPFRRRRDDMLDPPLEALPVLMEVTRYFYQQLPLAVSKNSAIAPSDLVKNGSDLINYLERVAEKERDTEETLLSAELPFTAVKEAVWNQIEAEAKKLAEVIIALGRDPGALTKRATDPVDSGASLRQIAEKRRDVQDAGGKKIRWGAAHFPFADRSGLIY